MKSSLQTADDLLIKAREFLQNGLAIQPILVKDQGEMTKLIFRDGDQTLACSTERFVKKLCQLGFLDLLSLQDAVKLRLNKKQLVPIPITFQFVLIPMRSLTPEQVKTRGFCWIVHRQLQECMPDPQRSNHSYVLLKNGQKLLVPYSIHFIHQQLRDAYLIEYLFHEIHSPLPHEQHPSFFEPFRKNPRDELHFQLLQIAETIRKYSS